MGVFQKTANTNHYDFYCVITRKIKPAEKIMCFIFLQFLKVDFTFIKVKKWD